MSIRPTPDGESTALWEENADWWQREFTDGADVEYVEQIVPLALDLLAGQRHIVDIGCGEGQITRALRAAGEGSGRVVVGIDPTVAQIREAQARGGGGYLVGGAEAMPFGDASFDGALACLVFEHIDDLHGALDEVARVLMPGGRFVFMLNHPLLQTPESGWIEDHIMEESYWRIGDYLHETATVEEVQKDVFIPFVHRPLHRYINAMAEAGLVIERMLEPAPPEGFVAKSPAFRNAAAIPRLLVLVAQRVPEDT